MLYSRFSRILALFRIIAFAALAAAIAIKSAATEPQPPPQSHYDAVVAADGSGTGATSCKTMQAAIAAAPANATKPWRILVKPGIYQGPICVPAEKTFIQLIGEPGRAADTVCTYAVNVHDRKTGEQTTNMGAGFLVLGGDFRAENITFENTAGDGGEARLRRKEPDSKVKGSPNYYAGGQARALRVEADRAVFENCRVLGWQDTLMIDDGRLYFKNCHIEGRTDFIYGSATAVFDHCEILSKNGGHITAASTPQGQPFGFVFLRCKLIGDPKPWNNSKPSKEDKPPQADLGRPWRPYATVAYIECEMGDHIKPEGWFNWNKPESEKTARYSEYKSTGPGANPKARVAWSRQLTDDEAKRYTVENILKGTDGWKP